MKRNQNTNLEYIYCRQVGGVHFISRYPLATLVLLILAVRGHHAEEVQKCPERLAVRRGQKLYEMLKCFLLKPPVPDLCAKRDSLSDRAFMSR